MEEISVITNSIEETAQRIIVKYVKFMKDITDEDSKIIRKTLKDGEDAGTVGQQLFEIASSRVVDAENVTGEMKDFTAIISKHFSSEKKEKLDKNELVEKCPFMANVWLGDLYGSKGLEGLKLLEEDLKKQLSEATSKNLVRPDHN